MTDTTQRLERYLERPLAVALALGKGGCGGTYVEACILVSAAISSVASFVWPGENGDRRRFVEAWKRFSGTDGALVSRPLLTQDLLKKNQRSEAVAIAGSRAAIFNPSVEFPRVLMGRDIDANDSALKQTCSSIGLDTLRAFSYPAIFYEEVRSNLVHEYELGDPISLTTMSSGKPEVSYMRRGATIRIHFHIEWLVEQARLIAGNADAALAAAAGPIPRPQRWWIQG